jgi:hypothetical protein
MSVNILAKLSDPENAIKIATEMSTASFQEVDGVQVIDVCVLQSTTVPRKWGTGPDGQYFEDYDLQLVINGRESVDDARLKSGISLIDTHNQGSVLNIYGKTLPGDKGGWRVENGGVYLRAKLSEIARRTGVADGIKEGTIDKVSLGFFILKATWDLTGERPLLVATLIQPFEFSLCSVPAIPDGAIVLSMKHNKENPMTTVPTVPVVAPVVPVAPEVVLAAPVASTMIVLAADHASVAPLMLAAKTLDPIVFAKAEARRVTGGTADQIALTIQAAQTELDQKTLSAANAISPSLGLPSQKAPEKDDVTLTEAKKPWYAVALAAREDLKKSLGYSV